MQTSDLITDPVEKVVARNLELCGVEYLHNVASPHRANGTIDFYLPHYTLYIECKRMATERIHQQLMNMENVLVVQGMSAAHQFGQLLSDLAHKTTEPQDPT